MQRRRRSWLIFWVILPWFLLAGVGFTAYRLYSRPAAPISSTVNVPGNTFVTNNTLPWPTTGQAAIGTLQDGLLASSGTQTAVPTASTAKIMTALAVLQKKPLKLGEQGPTITITARDIAIYNDYYAKDGSLARVALGEQISQYQAMQALMLPSANNFADTLAIWAFGSLENYSAFANDYAKRLGMTNSNFADASGFSPSTASTARDMTLLAAAAMKQPALAQIAGQSSAIIPVAGEVYNYNSLLGKYGVNGLKTGNTPEAGGAFVFSAKQKLADGTFKDIVGAVMKAPDRVSAINASPPLITATPGQFVTKQVLQAGQNVGSYRLPWSGKSVNVVARDNADLTLFNGAKASTIIQLDALSGQRSKGDRVGTATITGGPQTVKVPLVLDADVSAPGIWWRLTHTK